MAKLIFSGDKFGGRVYEFAVEKTTVGRGGHNTLTIHDPSVSNSHCEILVWGDEVIVRDLGSSNGTLVNGVRLRRGQRQLKHGGVVQFGDVEARLMLDERPLTDTVTGETAVHGYVRHLQQQAKGKAGTAPNAPLKPDAGTSSAQAEHTVLLPHPPEAVPVVSQAAPRSSVDDAPSKLRVSQMVIGAGLALGLGVVIWLLFSNR